MLCDFVVSLVHKCCGLSGKLESLVLETLMHTVYKHSELCGKMLTTISADSRAAVTALHTSVDKLSDTVTAISANHRDAVGSVIRETADAAQKREEHAQLIL